MGLFGDWRIRLNPSCRFLPLVWAPAARLRHRFRSDSRLAIQISSGWYQENGPGDKTDGKTHSSRFATTAATSERILAVAYDGTGLHLDSLLGLLVFLRSLGQPTYRWKIADADSEEFYS